MHSDLRNSVSSTAEAEAAASSSSATASHTAHTSATVAGLPDPSLPAPELSADEAGFTAADLIAQQARLEAQANEAIPFQFDACTYEKGNIRQPVYACKTCGGGGVCAGCSVSCHAEHDLVELFNKRNFRCDCGTPNIYRNKKPNNMGNATSVSGELSYPTGAVPCTLRKPGFDPQNDANRYNHNFEGSFCYCEKGQVYDAEKEEETMFQCIVCEEWLHESCTSLRPSARSSPVKVEAAIASTMSETEPPLIDHDLFDLMICDACVRKPGHEVLRSYAGSAGWIVLVRTEDADDVPDRDAIARIQVPTQEELETRPAEIGRSWQIYGLPLVEEQNITQDRVAAAADGALLSSVAELARKSCKAEADNALASTSSQAEPQDVLRHPNASAGEGSSLKRIASTSDYLETQTHAKRPKMESADANTVARPRDNVTCRAPSPLAVIAKAPQSVTDDWKPALATENGHDDKAQRCDIFLNEDFRSRICRCTDCLPRWTLLPHVLEAEETYAPPSDPHASLRGDDDDAASITSSTYDLGMAALRTMPREQMINSLHAYSKFRDALWEHLRPFAGSGKVVKEEDVRTFFKKNLESNK